MGLLRVLEADAQVHLVLLFLHKHLLRHHLHHRYVRAHACCAPSLTIGGVLLLRLTDPNARVNAACTSATSSCSSDALVGNWHEQLVLLVRAVENGELFQLLFLEFILIVARRGHLRQAAQSFVSFF
jgi:hypothetical protein